MDPETVVTFGLGAALLAAFGVGAVLVIKGFRFAENAKEQLMEAIAHATRDADAKVNLLTAKLELLQQKQQHHELYTEREFLSKTTANLVFDRIEKAIAESKQSIESRLIRMEEKVDHAVQGNVAERAAGRKAS